MTEDDRILFTVIFRYNVMAEGRLIGFSYAVITNIFLMTLQRYACIICFFVLRFIIADDRNGAYQKVLNTALSHRDR